MSDDHMRRARAIAIRFLEWRKIAGLRDILAHAYFQVENEIIWDVVQNKVQSLPEQVQNLLNEQLCL